MNLNDRILNVMSSILDVPVERLNSHSNKDNVEGWDSLKHMNLLLALEQEFNVTLPDEDAANITSFQLIHLILSELITQQ